ncbi:MAG: efflux RND transporter periplasmic adaptor subunit [Candidatus Aminicenantes bacterium]|nr:efflux RND transporter periplasmic adaptor subunit [Candidatus Aminicenantes bacterium]MCJ7487773.1 efflux RND transporter periplasmic adaptor subunit [Candidatus Aminicenantes bacterium]
MTEKTSFLKRRKKPLIILAILLVVGVIVVANLRSQREKTVKVTVDKVKKQDLTSIISASGEVKPKKNINISAQVPGRIIKIGVEEGEVVKAGDFLLKLDSTQYEAIADRDQNFIRAANSDLIQAEARLQRDKNSYERQQKLFDEQLISKDLLETAKAQFDISSAQTNAIRFQIKQAEASLKSTIDNLNKTTYDSPIDGVITSLRVEEGEVAIIGTMNNPGTVLLTIADLSVMEVEVEVDETDVIGVGLGQESNIRVDAFPETVFKGKVTEIGSSALQRTTGGVSTQESKDFKVVITLENPSKKLKPGLSASADIIVAEKKQALAVPISALVLRDKVGADASSSTAQKDEEGVYAVENARVKFQPVGKGITGGMMIEITSGLQEGQDIVTGPYASLRDLKDGVLIKTEPKKDAPTK